MSTLYLVGTPIGNLEDMTFRAVRILQEVDVIACEDTRVTGKLTHHYDIKTPLKSYHEHNKDKMTAVLVAMLEEGKSIALVSDAGLPLISDPGYELVTAVRDSGLSVVTVPGPNAALTALMTSGLSSYSFLFNGFLPRKESEKLAKLKLLMEQPHSILLYESPYRIKDTLTTIATVDEQRKVALARELTKRYEQVVTLPVGELLLKLEEDIPLKGEFVVVIDGQYDSIQQEQWWDALSLNAHVDHYIAAGQSSKDAIKQVAVDRGIKKREVYESFHIQS
ncbi:16S rRNA (cytidine(1402)-2'-O)-methyltransferase [Macrococcus equipercicus]|uniref:Ribosomal RNA small subunit methyltransferase I n=1 Tax=Macrococcus equipercicus TaxID=69967 RepID=A0A9Q9BVJ3_9STAP|nr:16S rRNA (cytidine(1402)-2'-O)-methyltransferase [Macrococcus equipercicus]KAA1036189.1 16S rRNA (cytidine(1402)-2'-O)-methyltransferase [Macrococcus equipercicus]UTH13748.1 16S rRNA (cytidine(1402)-2'-O)-methyltransferase [Macrococcus equipercicus]